MEPFVEGDPGAHVLAAISTVEAAGLAVEFGPFGNVIDGERNVVLDALNDAFRAAIDNGASRIRLTLTNLGDQ